MSLCSTASATTARIEGLANALLECHIDMIARDVFGNPGENREGPQAAPVRVPAAPPPPATDEQLEAQMDAILEKISRSGKESLTEHERAVLLRASEAMKRRRH